MLNGSGAITCLSASPALGGTPNRGFAVSLPPNLPAGNYTVFTAIFLDGNTINPTIGRMDFRSN